MSEIRVEGLVHVYPDGGVRALDGVDLRIGAGERVALVGQNGSGKTTLARHLNGLLRLTEGSVSVEGVDAATLTVAPRVTGSTRLPGSRPPDLRGLGACRGRVRAA